MDQPVVNYQKPTYCRWCGQPVELTTGKLYPWQHAGIPRDWPSEECTRPEPAKVGEQLPFVGAQQSVLQGSNCVARACSKTMAKRIARALNNHKVNSEGV